MPMVIMNNEIEIKKHDGSEYDLTDAELLKVGQITVELGRKVIETGEVGGYWYNIFVGPYEEKDVLHRDGETILTENAKLIDQEFSYKYEEGGEMKRRIFGKKGNEMVLCSSGMTYMTRCSEVLEAFVLTNGTFDW